MLLCSSVNKVINPEDFNLTFSMIYKRHLFCNCAVYCRRCTLLWCIHLKCSAEVSEPLNIAKISSHLMWPPLIPLAHGLIEVAGALIVGRYPTRSWTTISSLLRIMLNPVQLGIIWLAAHFNLNKIQRKFFCLPSVSVFSNALNSKVSHMDGASGRCPGL